MTRKRVADTPLGRALLEARRPGAPINERLEIYSEVLLKEFPRYANALDRLLTRLIQTGAGASAPNVGDALPPFLLPNEEGRLVGLPELLASGPVALTFQRGHWCPFCRIHASALADAQKAASAFGGRIVVVSPEREAYTRQHKADAQGEFLILSDIANGYAASLNLAIWVGEEMERILAEGGRDISTYQGTSGWLVPIPATFVVARDGTIKARFVDPDYRRRMGIDELLAALKAAAS